ncbi:MAG TPA: hypothetical protein VFC35_08710 [Gemmatimonadaceae bacterium]|nr:hypothetical protein [Gemmatimonadaceae bacterium]
MKRTLQVLALVVVMLAVVVMARAVMFTPKRVEVPAAPAFTPPPGAVDRLAGAIKSQPFRQAIVRNATRPRFARCTSIWLRRFRESLQP